jgi:hypothetical protein
LKKCFWGTASNVYIGFANDLSRHELGALEVACAQTMKQRRLGEIL